MIYSLKVWSNSSRELLGFVFFDGLIFNYWLIYLIGSNSLSF